MKTEDIKIGLFLKTNSNRAYGNGRVVAHINNGCFLLEMDKPSDHTFDIQYIEDREGYQHWINSYRDRINSGTINLRYGKSYCWFLPENLYKAEVIHSPIMSTE